MGGKSSKAKSKAEDPQSKKSEESQPQQEESTHASSGEAGDTTPKADGGTATEEAKPDEVKPKEEDSTPKAEDVTQEEAKPEEPKQEEVKQEETKPEEVTQEETKPEEVKQEETKPEEDTTPKADDDTATEEAKPEEVVETVPFVFRWDRDGTDVSVSGDFNKWETKIPLTKSSDGDFTVTVDVPVGKFEYKYFVDGEWQFNPKQSVADDDMGGCNNVATVTKEAPEATTE